MFPYFSSFALFASFAVFLCSWKREGTTKDAMNAKNRKTEKGS